jgi:hypothetical protein
MNFEDPSQSSIKDLHGQSLAYFRKASPSNLVALRLSGPPVGPKVGPSPLGNGRYYIIATWSAAEIQRWAAYQALMSAPKGVSDDRSPNLCPAQSSQSPTSVRRKSHHQQPVSVEELGQLVGAVSLSQNKSSGEHRTSFMFPSLHPTIADAVAHEIPSSWFNERDSELDSNNSWDTNVMGEFRCDNRRCHKSGWGSMKVAIRIRGYPKNGYNAVVYNQRCKSCDTLGNFTLDEASYVERVSYWLKRWAGIQVERPEHDRGAGPPHEAEFCEGGKHGHCKACKALLFGRIHD